MLYILQPVDVCLEAPIIRKFTLHACYRLPAINHVTKRPTQSVTDSPMESKACENAKKFPHSAVLGFETSFTSNNSDLSSLALPYLALGTFVPTLKLIFDG